MEEYKEYKEDLEYASDIDQRISDAVEYFKDHPNKIDAFLNSELRTDDPIEVYIFENVKIRLIKEVY